MFDLAPAADRMSRLVQAVPDDQLTATTPCEEWTVADLLDHVHGFTQVFIANGRKQEVPEDAARGVDGARLPDDWRTRLPQRLAELATVWGEESAWQGRVSAGGIEMSAADNALVVVEELTMHGWDLARATGQQTEPDGEALDAVEQFLEVFAEPIASGNGPYGEPMAVSDDASRFDRLLGVAGRDPAWRSQAG